MSFFSILSIIIVAGAFLLSSLKRMAILECKEIKFADQPTSKIVLITGANSGLGYYSSLSIAKTHTHVVMACRNMNKCNEARERILNDVPGGQVDAMQLDLSSFESIKKFSTAFTERYDHLDVLVNNAGIMALPNREVTKDGLEAQIGTNHFGHFLLTSLLFPHFAQNGRIINHSSGAHRMHLKDFPFSNILSETNYEAWGSYGNSKVANLLFTFELNRRLKKSGNPKNLMSVAVHPGYTATNLQADRFPLWEYANKFLGMSGEDGSLAQTQGTVTFHAEVLKTSFLLNNANDLRQRCHFI